MKVKVSGIHCPNCRRRGEAIMKQFGSDVSLDIEGNGVIEGNFDWAALVEAMAEVDLTIEEVN